MSSVSSGWNDATRKRPSRSSTGSPSNSASTSTAGADLGDPRRADEDAADRALTIGQLQVSLEARHLPTVGVAPYENVDEAKVVAVEEDHPGAGPEDGPGEPPQRLLEPVDPDQAHDRGRFPAGDDEPVEVLELLRLAHLDRLGAEAPQHGRVLAEVALDGEDSDLLGHSYQPRVSSSSSGRSDAAERPDIASPRPRETCARIFASL